ncbi:MAG: YncE family protein, partial [bacterium]
MSEWNSVVIKFPLIISCNSVDNEPGEMMMTRDTGVFLACLILIGFTAGPVYGQISIGSSGSPVDSVFANGFIYTTNAGSDDLTQVDIQAGTVVATIPVGNEPRAITYDGTNLWVVHKESENVYKLDPTTGNVISTTSLNGPGYGIGTNGDSVWVTKKRDQQERNIVEIDPDNASIVERTFLKDEVATTVKFIDGWIWVA